MKIRVLLWMILFLLFSAPASAGLNVVATLPWIGSIAREIGGDRVRVRVLVRPTHDAHYVEARPSMILAVRRADLFMYNGLDLEAGYLPVLVESSRNPRIQPGMPGDVDCSRFVEVLQGEAAPVRADRSLGDIHPLGNPHYHLSPKNIARVARGMADSLSAIDPGNRDLYMANLAAFERKLAQKLMQWSGAGLEGSRFVAYHRFFEYLAAELGFHIVGYIEEKPGIPPSAAHIQEVMGRMKEDGVTKILTTVYQAGREGRYVSERTGAELVVLPHDVGSVKGVEDWFGLIDRVLEGLKGGTGGGR